jgi:hypothetical protein
MTDRYHHPPPAQRWTRTTIAQVALVVLLALGLAYK